MDDPRTRAADADRNRVVAFLQQQVGSGRLTVDEFADRSTAAYQSRTLGELSALTADLPAPAASSPSASPARLLPVPAIVVVLTLVLLAGAVVLALVSLGDTAFMGHMMDHMTGR